MELHRGIYNIRGMYQKDKDALFQNKALHTILSLGQESVMKKENI